MVARLLNALEFNAEGRGSGAGGPVTAGARCVGGRHDAPRRSHAAQHILRVVRIAAAVVFLEGNRDLGGVLPIRIGQPGWLAALIQVLRPKPEIGRRVVQACRIDALHREAGCSGGAIEDLRQAAITARPALRRIPSAFLLDQGAKNGERNRRSGNGLLQHAGALFGRNGRPGNPGQRPRYFPADADRHGGLVGTVLELADQSVGGDGVKLIDVLLDERQACHRVRAAHRTARAVYSVCPACIRLLAKMSRPCEVFGSAPCRADFASAARPASARLCKNRSSSL
jgi:hypothetical protein